MLQQGTLPLRGMPPETIVELRAQRSFCSEALLTKNTKNAFAQNNLLVRIKAIVFERVVGEYLNCHMSGTLPQAIWNYPCSGFGCFSQLGLVLDEASSKPLSVQK